VNKITRSKRDGHIYSSSRILVSRQCQSRQSIAPVVPNEKLAQHFKNFLEVE
jgi:hypothetical protein